MHLPEFQTPNWTKQTKIVAWINQSSVIPSSVKLGGQKQYDQQTPFNEIQTPTVKLSIEEHLGRFHPFTPEVMWPQLLRKWKLPNFKS